MSDLRPVPAARSLPASRVAAAGLVAAVAVALALPAGAGCSGRPGYDALDFWLGTWTVRVGERTVGTNEIAAILDGCAVEERWTDAAGGEGRSLFWRDPGSGDWKQVWVTGEAWRIGGTKVKERVAADGAPAGSVRFRGSYPGPSGGAILDRTTLTPLDGGRVRQTIERSTDGGATWTTGFDAIYEPRAADDQAASSPSPVPSP